MHEAEEGNIMDELSGRLTGLMQEPALAAE